MAWSNLNDKVLDKSLVQMRDAGRYVKFKDLKPLKLSYICKFYRSLFLKSDDSIGNLINAVKTGFLREGKD